MPYFRTALNNGRWDVCNTCEAAPGDRCRHVLNGTFLVTVHEGRRKLGRAEFDEAKAEYERRSEDRKKRAEQLRIMREAERVRQESRKYITLPDGGVQAYHPPQPAEKPPGAQLVRTTMEYDHLRDYYIREDEYQYQYYRPVWNNWVGTGTTTSASINITPQTGVWRQWTAVSNATMTATYHIPAEFVAWQQDVWHNWTRFQVATENAAAGIQRFGRAVGEAAMAVQQTDEEIQRRMQERRDREQARREAESRERLAREKRLQGARERASELLEMVLSEAEKQYRAEHNGRILVRSQNGNLYEIDTNYGGVHGNIVKVDEHGCQLGRLCVAPGMYDNRAALPLEDGYVG